MVHEWMYIYIYIYMQITAFRMQCYIVPLYCGSFAERLCTQLHLSPYKSEFPAAANPSLSLGLPGFSDIT